MYAVEGRRSRHTNYKPHLKGMAGVPLKYLKIP